MDISNINGISTGDIKSFFNNISLTKTDKTDSFTEINFLLAYKPLVCYNSKGLNTIKHVCG